MKPIKVVFVCLGNICRSPMAEVVFRHLVSQAGLSDQIQIDSAATSSWEVGNPIYPKAGQTLYEHHLSAEGLRSRQVRSQDFESDYLIGMDRSNMTELRAMSQGRIPNEFKRLLDYTPLQRDIADPWYTGDFDQTYHDVLFGCKALLAYLCEKEHLVR